MLKPFVLSLAFATLSATVLGADEASSDRSTWRWSVSRILDAQRPGARINGLPEIVAYSPGYMRYSVNGQPEAADNAPRK